MTDLLEQVYDDLPEVAFDLCAQMVDAGLEVVTLLVVHERVLACLARSPVTLRQRDEALTRSAVIFYNVGMRTV